MLYTALDMDTDTDSEYTRRLIELRHSGASWKRCGAELGRTRQAMQMQARRLRDAGKWTLPDGSPARGAPVLAGPATGRPRNDIPSVSLSLRFALDVDLLIRELADAADMRLGQVVAEAMTRAVARANRKRVSRTPLGLTPGEPTDVAAGRRSITIGVNVPQPLYEQVEAIRPPDVPMMTLVAEQVHRMLADLNYRLVDGEG